MFPPNVVLKSFCFTIFSEIIKFNLQIFPIKIAFDLSQQFVLNIYYTIRKKSVD